MTEQAKRALRWGRQAGAALFLSLVPLVPLSREESHFVRAWEDLYAESGSMNVPENVEIFVISEAEKHLPFGIFDPSLQGKGGRGTEHEVGLSAWGAITRSSSWRDFTELNTIFLEKSRSFSLIFNSEIKCCASSFKIADDIEGAAKQIGALNSGDVFGGYLSCNRDNPGRCPQANGRNGKNDSEHGNDAFVVLANKLIQAPKKDQRSEKERGAGLLVILIAGALVLLWAYEAGTTRP
jgi:hypothetical protein